MYGIKKKWKWVNISHLLLVSNYCVTSLTYSGSGMASHYGQPPQLCIKA
jgi:hypothetical protein